MGNVLTASSDVECGHKGLIAVVGSAKLTVGGNPVLLQTGVASMAVAACTTPPTPSTKPCKTVRTVLPLSLATKLTAGGQPVVLDTLVGVTDGLPPGALFAVAGQSKLTAI